jgi:hypothetical protein
MSNEWQCMYEDAEADLKAAQQRVAELEREKRELSCDLLTAHRETMEHAGRIIELEREVARLRCWAWEDESKSTDNMPDGYAP